MFALIYALCLVVLGVAWGGGIAGQLSVFSSSDNLGGGINEESWKEEISSSARDSPVEEEAAVRVVLIRL